MDMGLPTNERASLRALIAAAAPAPLPAEQALELLRRLGETDAATLGRLAYHALTGVDPGDGDPQPPAVVAPGFPPFAAEVLMRAISGPDHRRPTAQALLIVLDTVPATSWPTAGRGFVTLDGPGATEPGPTEPVTGEPIAGEPDAGRPDADAAPVAPVVPVVPVAEESGAEESGADVEPDVPVVDEPVSGTTSEKARLNDEFRSLLTPSRPIPRFDPLSDPLTDPWEPDVENDPVLAPLNLGRVPRVPEIAEEPVAEDTDEPVAVAEETVAEESDEPVADAEETAAPSIEEPVAEQPMDEEAVAEEPPVGRGMHDEFRNFASPGFDVPRFEPLDGELPAGSDRERRRRAGGRRHPEKRDEPATQKAPKAQKAQKAPKAKPEKPKKPKKSDRTDEPEKSEKSGKPDRPEKPQKPAKPEKQKQTVVHGTSADDRRQTLLLVALLLVLVVLGAVFAASRDSDDEGDSGPEGASSPQGASRSLIHPAVDPVPAAS